MELEVMVPTEAPLLDGWLMSYVLDGIVTADGEVGISGSRSSPSL
jgi:hypothetical protein